MDRRSSASSAAPSSWPSSWAPGPLSRMFWVVFPLLTFFFLLLTFIMVITPMKQPGGG